MAIKYFSLFFSFSFVLVLLTFLTFLTHNTLSQSQNQPFGFLKNLQGYQKGDNITGIHQLKIYLQKFGYLSYSNPSNINPDHNNEFDELLETAIKMYQKNLNLQITGILDFQTISTMMLPRCGVPDIIYGGSSMRSRTRAFDTWASNSQFKFNRIEDFTKADIKVGFHSRDHGDGVPFDGKGGVLAHSFAPTDGRFHLDAEETWGAGAIPNEFDMETIALHEIGHLLGLGHSSDQGAIMYPSISEGMTKGLGEDDIQGIKALYNKS
ncbi:hypothetical protein ACFE04_021219 [Oxalis oulophora]